jgi:glucose/arabinose dehydrogenase
MRRAPLRAPARRVLAAAVIAALGLGCEDGGGGPPAADVPARWEPVAIGLAAPTHAASPAGDPRIFVVEREGRVRIVKDGALLPEPFLDVVPLVVSGGEQGLLSVAFHPGFATNGRFFVYYTGSGGDLVIAEYAVPPATPDRADASSGRVLLSVPHRAATNHNGGQLAFGPDGYLYAGTGDGGGGGDPEGNAQDTSSLLGKLLRLDVDAGSPYAVPATNPGFAAPEIWAYGLRNPWRFSFDRATGDLYVGDVGQNAWEEIDFQPAASAGGENYGWNLMEGDGHCYGGADCLAPGLDLVRPVVEYPNPAQGCSVTGGFVYRGAAIPALQGAYLYGDFCSGGIRSFRIAGGVATERADLTASLGGPLEGLASFGEDGAGELLAVQLGAGRVLRLVPRP